jgi:hypothetical protein
VLRWPVPLQCVTYVDATQAGVYSGEILIAICTDLRVSFRRFIGLKTVFLQGRR